MKNLFLICIVIVSTPLYGQEKNEDIYTSKHELSIVIDDIFAKNAYVSYPPIYYDYASSLYYYPTYPVVELNAPKIGLGYKFHFENSAIRSKLSLGVGNHTSENKIDTNTTESSLLTTGIELGYELHKNLNKTQIFYGADLFVNYGKRSSKSKNINNSESYSNESSRTNMAYGICPLIGVRYYISPAISVSTELKFFIESIKSETRSKYSGDTNENINETSGLNTRFGPQGQVSINIHL